MMQRIFKQTKPSLEFGFALALSFGGILYSIVKIRRMTTSKSSLTRCPSGELGDDYHALHQDNHVPCRPRVTIDASVSSFSPTIRSNSDRDEFDSPEFDDLVNDDIILSDQVPPRGCKCVQLNCREQEITSLRNTVKILKEKERSLEIQLLEYYGLKEQETAVMELQNRLKINNVEAKLFNLKIESLQSDNRRLEAQVSEYTKVVTDLEAARSKIKLLKRKFRSEADQHKEKISALQKRVANLQDNENGAVIDPNTQQKLQKLKEFEDEAEELRKANYSLRLENTELAEKLEYVQVLATSCLENEEMQNLKEEAQQLRKQNEDLTKEIEQLQVYRNADVQELVYLRWVNAFLRNELKKYQPENGKSIFKDLSKTLSPKTEEKAKQIILEYTYKEGEKGLNTNEIEFDQWSSSQASCPADSGELDESLMDNSSLNNKSTNSVKRKFLNKLKKLLKVKEGRNNNNSHSQTHSRASSEERQDLLIEDESPLRNSSASDHGTNNGKPSNSSQGSRRSLDIPRSSPGIPRLKTAKSESLPDDHENENGRKFDVRKYGEASKESRRHKVPRRSASCSSFLN